MNFYIEVEGKIKISMSDNDLILGLKIKFPQLKEQEEVLRFKLESFNNSFEEFIEIDGITFKKIFIKQVNLESEDLIKDLEDKSNEKPLREELKEKSLHATYNKTPSPIKKVLKFKM